MRTAIELRVADKRFRTMSEEGDDRRRQAALPLAAEEFEQEGARMKAPKPKLQLE